MQSLSYENLQVAEQIGIAMKKMGLSEASDVKPYTPQELEEVVGSAMVST